VIVTELDVIRISIDEPKADTPLIVYSDSMLASSVSLERVQPVSGRGTKILQACRQVDILQPANCPTDDIRRHASGHPLREQVGSTPIREGLDHRDV
jgi:hypothetical protein